MSGRLGRWHVYLTFPSLPPSLSSLPPFPHPTLSSLPPPRLQDDHPSLLLLLVETFRVASASILLDLSQMPFVNVALCAVAGQGRLPCLQAPFQGYSTGFRAIVAAEVCTKRGEGGTEVRRERVRFCLPLVH